MNTGTPKSSSKSNKRKRPSTSRWSSRAKRRRSTQQEQTAPHTEKWYIIKDIIDEKIEDGQLRYLFDWESDAETGESYEPSWEPADLANEEAVIAWKQSERYFELHPEERPAWREQVDDLSHSGYIPNNSDSSQYSGVGEQQSLQDILPRDRLSGEVQIAGESREERRTGTFERLRAGNRFLELESEDFSQSSSSTTHLGALVTEGAEAQIANNLVVLLPQRPSLDPLDYRRIQLSQDSISSNPAFRREDHQARRLIDQLRVIPDSQEVSEATNSGPRDDLAAGQGFESGGASQLSNHSVTDEIPSHQPEPDLSAGRLGQVNSEIVAFHQEPTTPAGTIDSPFGASGHSTSHSSQRSEVVDQEPDYLTQLPFDTQVVPPTSSAAPTHSVQRSNIDSDQRRLDSGSQATGDTSLQAAQIVPPLVSRSEDFSSQINPRTSNHHDIEDTVPGTVSRPVFNAPNTQDSQRSRQALSELDGNTRSSSSVPSSQVLSGSFGEKHRSDLVTGIEANQITPRPSFQSHDPNSSRLAADTPKQLHSSTQRSHSQMNMESAPSSNGKTLSARERLLQLQEQAFAEIESDGPTLHKSSVQNSAVVANSAVEGPQAPPVTESDGPPSSTIKDSVTIQDEASGMVPRLNEETPNPAPPSIPPPGLVPSVESEHHPEIASHPPSSDYVLPHHEAGELGEPALENREDVPPVTLDSAALSLSIEHDVAASPSNPTDDGIPSVPVAQDSIESPGELAKPLEQVDLQNSSGTVLSYILTAANEYLITLPLANNIREQYNQVLRQYGESLASYNAAFTTSPHQKVHPALVSKVDAMFHQLFDMCDLPPFLETVPSMRPEYVTKHVRGTNSKFAFILEFLEHLRKLGSEKKVLILARPGQIVTLLDTAIKTEGYSHEHTSANTIVSSSNAQQPLTAMVASTVDDLSLLPRDFDVVIAYDHTFQQRILPPRGDGGDRMTMVLATTASIEHINLRISDRADPLERRNILISALCSSAVRGAIEYPGNGFQEPHKIAELFAKYLELPDNDDFYWRPQELPDGTFDDVFASSQVDPTQTPSAANGVLEHEKARKRSHDSDEERLSKRPRMTHPPMGPKEAQMSDTLTKLLGRRTSPGKATVEVSMEKLETLATKFANMELEFEEATSQRDQFRELSDRTKSELDSWVRTVNKLQRKFMTAVGDRGSFDAQAKAAQREAQEALVKLEKSEAQKVKLEEENKDLKSKLLAATESLLNSANPDIAHMALLQKERDEATAKLSGLERKVETTQNELDFIRDRYQQQSTAAKDLLDEKSTLERRIQELSRKADDNVVKVNEIQARSEAKALKAMLDEQKTIVIEREVELSRCRDELRSLKSNRRETRQTSVPRSPRLSSLGVMSPRHANNHHARERNAGVTASSSVSRNTSPGPPGVPPTGVFEGGHFFGVGGQTGNGGRYSHLRD